MSQPDGTTELYRTCQRQNEGSSSQQNAEDLTESAFELMEAESITNGGKQADELLEASQCETLAIVDKPTANTCASKQPPKQLETLHRKEIPPFPETSYWIDGTELGQHLESTQAQALRNFEACHQLLQLDLATFLFRDYSSRAR